MRLSFGCYNVTKDDVEDDGSDDDCLRGDDDQDDDDYGVLNRTMAICQGPKRVYTIPH